MRSQDDIEIEADEETDSGHNRVVARQLTDSQWHALEVVRHARMTNPRHSGGIRRRVYQALASRGLVQIANARSYNNRNYWIWITIKGLVELDYNRRASKRAAVVVPISDTKALSRLWEAHSKEERATDARVRRAPDNTLPSWCGNPNHTNSPHIDNGTCQRRAARKGASK